MLLCYIDSSFKTSIFPYLQYNCIISYWFFRYTSQSWSSIPLSYFLNTTFTLRFARLISSGTWSVLRSLHLPLCSPLNGLALIIFHFGPYGHSFICICYRGKIYGHDVQYTVSNLYAYDSIRQCRLFTTLSYVFGISGLCASIIVIRYDMIIEWIEWKINRMSWTMTVKWRNQLDIQQIGSAMGNQVHLCSHTFCWLFVV